ncbi:MAG: glycosyltransferase family 2 protein [Microgenomates group bacterium]
MGRNYKKSYKDTTEINTKPLVSIIIPTYNEEKNIDTLLSSIIRQQYKEIEIIVVDQSSTDKTAEIAKQYGAIVINLPKPKFYSPPGNNRNIGTKKASGSILLHLDADMELPKSNFIDNFIKLFDKEHRAVIIHEVDIAEGFWNKCKALERSLYWNTEMEAARGVSMELFEQVQGYDRKISSGEDFHISSKYEEYTKINSSKQVFLHHRTGYTSLKSLLKKKFNYGKTAKLFLSDTKNGQKKNIAIISLRIYLRNWKLLFTSPIYYVCIFLLRFFELMAVNLGMVYQETLLKITSDR